MPALRCLPWGVRGFRPEVGLLEVTFEESEDVFFDDGEVRSISSLRL